MRREILAGWAQDRARMVVWRGLAQRMAVRVGDQSLRDRRDWETIAVLVCEFSLLSMALSVSSSESDRIVHSKAGLSSRSSIPQGNCLVDDTKIPENGCEQCGKEEQHQREP